MAAYNKIDNPLSSYGCEIAANGKGNLRIGYWMPSWLPIGALPSFIRMITPSTPDGNGKNG